MTDITSRKRAEEDLLNYQQRLRSLTSQLSLTEEHERRRIATNLHDTISQNLAVANMKLDSLRKGVPGADPAGSLDEIHRLIEQALHNTRSLTFELSPPVLYRLGLAAAVSSLTDRMQEQHDIQIDFRGKLHTKALPGDLRVTLFRAVHELLINVVKHARTRSAKVTIRKSENQVQVEVTDDGIGFDSAKVSYRSEKNGGFGLFNIHERLSYLGGKMEIKSKPGGGTRITLTAPLAGKRPKEKVI